MFNLHKAVKIKWLSASDLQLNSSVAREWDLYVFNLHKAGISLKNSEDKLVWTRNVSEGTVTARLAYNSILEQELSIAGGRI